MRAENLRTYPVYYPGREPAGYWEMLQHMAPKPLIEPGKLKTKAEWIGAGRRVFDEADDLHLRTYDPKLIARGAEPRDFRADTYTAISGRNFGRHTMGAHQAGCRAIRRKLQELPSAYPAGRHARSGGSLLR